MEYYCGIDLGTSSVKVMLLGATVLWRAQSRQDMTSGNTHPVRQSRIWNISGSGQGRA